MSHYAALARRLYEVRLEVYGEEGGPLLARSLGLPERTWAHYESGVSIPGMILLRFIDVTGVEPHWLFDRRRPKGSGPPRGSSAPRRFPCDADRQEDGP